MDFSREFYEEILSELNDGLYIVDRKRVIMYWNKAAERISGFSAEEVVGKSCAQSILSHIDNDGKSLCSGNCPLGSVLSDGLNREDEVFLHHRNGYRVPVSVRVSPLRDDKGNIVGAAELFTDLREKDTYRLRIRELEKMALVDSRKEQAYHRIEDLSLIKTVMGTSPSAYRFAAACKTI